MRFACLTSKRQVRCQGKNLQLFQGLEQLENRLLLATDMPTAVAPDLSATMAIEVDNLTGTDVKQNDTSGETGRRVNPLGTHEPLKVKGYKFAKSNTGSLKQEQQEATSGHGQEQAFAELDKLLSGIAGSTESHRDWVGQWASRYVALSANLGPEMAKQTVVAVLKGFGEKFAPESSEIFAFKTHGSDSFKQAYTNKGNNAAVSDLKLWRSRRMESKLQSAGIASGIEAYVYTARFGSGPSHMGTALARTHWTGTQIVFLPMAMVKADGLSAKDAAAFFAHQLDGRGDFTDFVRNRHGEQQPAGQTHVDNPIRRAARWGCDYRALAACSAEILGTLESELEAAEEAHEQSVNQIMDQYGEDAVDGLMEWIVDGAIPGALFGAATGGPIGALIWGLAGAIGGAIAAMTVTANDADDIQEALDAADADYADAVCQAKGRAIDSLGECIREYCPDAAEAAEQWAQQQISLEDCVRN